VFLQNSKGKIRTNDIIKYTYIYEYIYMTIRYIEPHDSNFINQIKPIRYPLIS